MNETVDQNEKAARRASMTGKMQIGAVIAVVVVSLVINRILMMSGGGGPEIVPAATAPAVSIIMPVPQRETIKLVETGTVQTRVSVSITPQVSGRIVRVAPQFASGGAFKAGEVLFEVDPTDFLLFVQQAEADLAAAMSVLQLEEAEGETARREWRLINGEEQIPALVAREPQIAQARASVQAAQARVADAQADLARTRYSLPFDGRVVRATIEIGQTVAANQSYGEAYRVDSVEVFVSLTDQALAAIEPAVGRSAIVMNAGGAPVMRATARIVRVDAQRDRQTRLAGVTLALERNHPFVPGAFVNVEITGDEIDDVFDLPTDMVTTDGAVWVVENGALVRRQTEVIARQAGVAIVKRFDIAEGVVSTPPPGARAGLAVHVFESEVDTPEANSVGED